MKLTYSLEFYHDPENFFRLENIENYSDGSGAYGLLTIQSKPFSCTQHSFYFEGLKSFCKKAIKLNETIKGSAGIGPTYEGEYLKLEATKLGQIIVSGELHIDSYIEQRLNFAFQSDQTGLRSLAQSAEMILDELKKG